MSERGSSALRSSRETLAGALVVALLALFFLRGPIAQLDEGVLGPDDFSQSFPLLTLDEPVEPANPALLHTWTAHQTWTRMSAERLRAGELPTWNGFNGGGLPHLANPQAAVFSPFSWSFYVFDPAWAAVIAAFAKLFVAGFATFLFLRELGLAFSSAIVGAVVFMFSGAEITTLLLPQSSTVILLPAGLFAAERIARAVDKSIRARRAEGERHGLVRLSIAFVLVISASFFGGALDTFAFCALVVAAWIVARLLLIWRRERFDLLARREIAIGAAHLVAVALIAACTCAIQALPYLEYLAHARAAPSTTSPLILPAWPMLFFPGLLGHAANLAAVSTGALPLLFAITGFAVTRRGRTGWFFAGVGVFGFFAGSLALGSSLFHGLFPLQAEPEVQRALVLFPFAIAVLAAFAIDRVASGEPVATAPVALGTFIVSATVIFIARSAADGLLETTLADSSFTGDHVLQGLSSSAHLDFVVATGLVGVGLFAFASTMQRTPRRAFVMSALALIVYLQCGAPLEDFNPVTPNRYVLPRTDDLDRRDGTVGIRGSLVLGGVDVPPAVNALYGLRSLAVNDPLRIRRFDQLHEQLFSPSGEFGVVTHTSRRALELFGIELILDSDGWVDVDTECGRPRPGVTRKRDGDTRSGPLETAEITSDTGVQQFFSPSSDGIEALCFSWITHGAPNAREYDITVDDFDTKQRILGMRVTPWEVRPRGGNVVDQVVPFPRDAKVAGRILQLSVTTSGGPEAGSSYAIARRSSPIGWIGIASQGDRAVDPLALDLAYAFDSFHHVDRVEPFGLYRYVGATSRFRTLGSARVVANDGASWSAILESDFDAASEVILEDAPAELARRGEPADEAESKLEVLDDLDGHVRLIVKRKTPGFVVTSIAWYPGWKARVNNAAARPLCANYAFTAVAVPAGESLVELEFAPKSVRNGLILSIVGLLTLLVAFAFTLPPEPRP